MKYLLWLMAWGGEKFSRSCSHKWFISSSFRDFSPLVIRKSWELQTVLMIWAISRLNDESNFMFCRKLIGKNLSLIAVHLEFVNELDSKLGYFGPQARDRMSLKRQFLNDVTQIFHVPKHINWPKVLETVKLLQ